MPSEAQSSQSRRQAAIVLAVLTAAYVLNIVDRSIVYILQEDIKAEFALADWQIGLLSGVAFGLFYSVMGIPIARLSETRSRTFLLKICVLLWSGMTALCGVANGFVALLLARIGVAVGEAGGSPLSHSIISDHFPPERRTTALAIFTVAVPLGLLVGAAGGGWLAQELGWRGAFVAVGAPGLLIAFLIHKFVPEPVRGRWDASPAQERPSLGEVVSQFLRNRRLMLVLAASSASAFAAWGVTSFMAAWFLRRFELDTQTTGLAFALIYGVAAGVGTWGGGWLNDKLASRDRRWSLGLPALCLTATAPLYIVGLNQTSTWVAAGVLCLPALLSNAHYGATFAAVNNGFGPRSRTTAVSLMFLCHAIIGISLGPLFTGTMSDVFTARAGTPASGLTMALCVTSLIFILAGALYAVAAILDKRIVGSEQ